MRKYYKDKVSQLDSRASNLKGDWLERKRSVPNVGEVEASIGIDRLTILDQTLASRDTQNGRINVLDRLKSIAT